MKAMTQKDLNEFAAHGCGDPTCTCDHSNDLAPMASVCHPKAGLKAAYDPKFGSLALICFECSAPIAKIEVAKGHAGPVSLDKAFTKKGAWKARCITTHEGRYLNLRDMCKALTDEALIQDCAAILRIGMERNDPIDAVRATIGCALREFAGDSTKGTK